MKIWDFAKDKEKTLYTLTSDQNQRYHMMKLLRYFFQCKRENVSSQPFKRYNKNAGSKRKWRSENMWFKDSWLFLIQSVSGDDLFW